MGTVNVESSETGKIILFSKDETLKGKRRKADPQLVLDFLYDSSDGISLSDYEDFLDKTKLKNAEFFTKLRQEITLCILAKKSKRYTESFVYFYRILEFISLAFPTIYARSNTDFKQSHSFLKALFKNEKDSDLKALERFVLFLAEQDASFESLKIEFKFEGVETAKAIRSINAIRKIVPNNSPIEFITDTDTIVLAPFTNVHEMIISIRNRMFHYRIGEENLDLAQLGGADYICEFVMKKALHWFFLIYSEIVRAISSEYIKG